MSEPLSDADLTLLIEALRYTRQAFEGYRYPTPEFRQQRLDDVDGCVSKIRALRAGSRTK